MHVVEDVRGKINGHQIVAQDDVVCSVFFFDRTSISKVSANKASPKYSF